MLISRNQPKQRITQNAQPKTEQMNGEQAYEAAMDAYYKESQAGEKFETIRLGASVLAGAATLGAAGHYLGGLTGVGGAVAGAVVGAAGGITVGYLGGAAWAEAADAGSGALGYVGIGAMAGIGAGALAGGYFGLDSIPVVGAIAGGLGGVAVGFFGGAMWNDAADNKLRAKHGLN